MTFLNPLALLGLIASTIPVILHLLNLRKLKIVEFSTLRFLKELQKSKIRRLKLKQILLLILRTLIIIFAVFAFSRPTIDSSIPFMSGYVKTSSVIIIDNSASMDVSDEFGNRLNQAKNAAYSIVNSLKEGDETAILTMTDNYLLRSKNLSRNLDMIKQELQQIKTSNKPGNLEKTLRIAAGLLDESMNINHEIYIITDAQSNIFKDENKDTLQLFANNTNIFFVPVGNPKNTVNNLSIDSLNVNTRIFMLDKPVEIDAIISNNSKKDATGIVVSMYFNGERVSQRSIDIAGNESKHISISASPQKVGINRAYIEIEQDALEVDNKRYFGFTIPPKPSIALIGDNSKLKFIQFALGAKSGSEPIASYQSFSANQLGSINFSNFDLVICACGPYQASDFQTLENYARKGGSLLMFADDKTKFEIFKAGLNKLGFGEAKELSFSANQPAQFSSVDKIHPLFDGVFKGTTDSRGIVESPKIIKAISNSAGQRIIEFAGWGFLSESRIGEGKVLYCAVTPDGEWSTLPVTGLFPTLIFRSLYYLSAKEQTGASVIVGQPLMLNLPKRFASGGNFRILDPKNTEFYKNSATLPSGAVLSFDNTESLGNYSVLSPSGQGVTTVSVNTDPTESKLTPLTKEDIQKALKHKVSDKANMTFLESAQNIGDSLQRARTGTELWQIFIILAILCSFAELYVARVSKIEREG